MQKEATKKRKMMVMMKKLWQKKQPETWTRQNSQLEKRNVTDWQEECFQNLLVKEKKE